VKLTLLDRFLLLLTGLLAAYQIAVGIDGMATPAILAYTIAFGILLVAGLLIIILGFDVLESPVVVVLSTVIPLSLSLGLVWEYLPGIRSPYLVYAIVGFLAILATRLIPMPNKVPVIVLALVHGIAGLAIFLLPVAFSLAGQAPPGFALVGLGGAFIGVGGLLLALLKAGKPLLPRPAILRILPGLLFMMTLAFVAGFAWA
jgi:hypothetical protein